MVNDRPPEDDEYDHEEDVRQIVAQLGVADFVYTVPVVVQGGATREVGDALLFSNGMGAILQMKARQADSRGEDGSAWVARRGGKAYRQGQGTRRMIVRRQSEDSTIIAYPVRAADWEAADRELAGLPLTMDVSGWPVVVILDHPSIEGIEPPNPDGFWITTADWLELNRALRSVTALLTYFRRVLEAGTDIAVPLGSEAERFRRIVAADAQYADAGGPISRPWLTASSLADPTGADLYRELLTRLWPPDASRPHVPISDLRRVLEFLDALPPGMQATVGRWILRKRGELRTGPWASGAVMWSGDRLLVFGCAPADRYDELERFDAELAAIACVRSREVREQGGLITAVLGVGHLIADGYIDYRYIYMEPPVDAPDDLKRIVLHTYGRFDLISGRAVEITAGRNDPCPCGSGRKFKHCAEL
jgi:hypothetical protein